MVEPSKDSEPASQDAPRGFEELLSRCIAAHAAEGAEALESILGEHPGDAGRLRARLSELERLGLLGLGAKESFPASIGGHRVVRRLGSGGMGDVFLATDPDSGEPVALKWARLTTPRTEDEQRLRLRARFEREARAIGRLSHPGIAGVHQVGEHEGRPWFTMDLVEGVTLAQVLAGLRARGVPPSELCTEDVRRVLETVSEDAPSGVEKPRGASYVEWAVRVVLEVAGALTHAHEHGIVHRDVKPSNIMLRFDGGVCLFDLGLAHLEDMPTITRSGDFAGTPYYVAPEQVEGRHDEVDGRTDVWGLAVALYELLTLRRPFEGESTPEILRRILEREPSPPARFHEGLPIDLVAILGQALEKSPSRRYRDMRAFTADLERFLAFRPVVARPPGALARLARLARRRPAVAAAWGLALLVAVGLPLGLFLANRAIRAEAVRTASAAAEARDQAAARARVVEHLVALFRAPEAAGEAMVAALDGELERSEVVAGEGALARASMLEAAGTIYRNLGLYERALAPLDRALALRTASERSSVVDTAALLEVLAGVHRELGDTIAAEALCRRGLAALHGLDAAPELVRARLSMTLARSLDPHAAREEVDDLLARAEAGLTGAVSASELADLVVVRAEHARALGELELARVELERAHGLRRASWLPDPARLAADLEQLAELEAEMGRGDAAAARRQEARELWRASEPIELGVAAPPVQQVPSWRSDYEASFQLGITALQARRTAEAIDRFQRCLELDPGSGVCAYNVACGYALSGDVDAALTWLERARDRGWGLTAGSKDLVRSDPDLVALRADPRLAELEAELAEDAERTRVYVTTPTLWVPDAAVRGLLVVLHGAGATKFDVAGGPWRAFAERHDLALLAPSAPRALQARPELGLAWFADPAEFSERPWSVERPVVEAIEEARRALGLEPSDVVLAGEGEGGSVALDLALRAPGTLRAVLVLDAPLLLAGAERRARVAAAMGLEVHAAYRAGQAVPHAPEGVSTADLASSASAWFAAAGLEGSCSLWPGSRGSRWSGEWDELLGRSDR